MIELVSETRPRARIRHQCDSCFGTIEPGTVYVRQAVRDCGDFWVYKSHEACRRAEIILWHWADLDELCRVCDMEPEDVETVRAEDPETARAVWGDQPAA